MASVEEHAAKFDLRGAMAAMIMSAFGFVAALFWRDAIQAFITEFVPEGQGIIYSFVVAIIVTIIAVIAIFFVNKYLTFSKQLEKKVKTRVKKR
jgi:ABC-type multidrug transport system fused ATPase/permease subunit